MSDLGLAIEESVVDVAFEDDSSAHLGLDHSPTSVEAQRYDGFSWNERLNARLKADEEAKGVSHAPKCMKCNQTEKHYRHTDKDGHAFEAPGKTGAYDDISAHIAQVREENPDLPEVDVVRIGRQRATAADPVITPGERGRDYMGAPTSVLMAHDAPKGGGSKSGNKNEKPSKWICNECHLEFCIHRIPKSRKKRTGNKVGRPTMSNGAGRSSKLTACVSPATPQAVKDDGTASAGEILEAVVETAQRQGVAISNVLENLDETKPKRCEHPGCPDDGGYAAFDDLASRYRYYCGEHIFLEHDWEKQLKETA